MKNKIGILVLFMFFIGCDMNPNKEERIQKLETEMRQSMEKINQLENKVENLEKINKQLQARIQEIENN